MAYSRGVNKVFLLGRIATDINPIQKDGKTIGCRFNVACDRPAVTRGKDANRQQNTDYIPCIAWSWVANHVIDRYSKGDQIFAIGTWTSGNYVGRDGKRVYTNACTLGEIHDLQSGNSTSGADMRTPLQTGKPQSEVDEILQNYEDSGNAISPDDLPF